MANKYVLVGTGGRSRMYQDALANDYRDSAHLVAICDSNIGRMKLTQDRLQTALPNLAAYHSDQFDQMLTEQKPDYVIVCTKDSEHDEYICRALNAGCNAITEKPMTTDHKKCQRIVDTVKKTGKTVRVTFNYRYSPPRTQMKDLLMKGIIGKVLSVDFQWLLDTNHGADYYRRWHRNKKNSGGLMVHKATHHFDLINWWLSSVPKSVSADGDNVFYNPEQAKRYGLQDHAERCLECQLKHKCNFYLDINAYKDMRELYLNCEEYDGYYRDRCVFGNDIDIEDTMNLTVKYENGAFLSYCLNSFSPWEGYRVGLNGTKGRLEQQCQESSYLNGDGTVSGAFNPESSFIRVYPHFQTPYEIEMANSEGAHGGGDAVMLDDLFGDLKKDDIYLRAADYNQGAYSILTGIAANMSMATDKKINIADLVKGLDQPVMPPMPDGSEKIGFVKNVIRSVNCVQERPNTPS